MEPQHGPQRYRDLVRSQHERMAERAARSNPFVSLQAVLTERDRPQKLNRLALQWQREDRLLGEHPPLEPLLHLQTVPQA